MWKILIESIALGDLNVLNFSGFSSSTAGFAVSSLVGVLACKCKHRYTAIVHPVLTTDVKFHKHSFNFFSCYYYFNFVGHKSFLWNRLHPWFGILVDFKVSVGSLLVYIFVYIQRITTVTLTRLHSNSVTGQYPINITR